MLTFRTVLGHTFCESLLTGKPAVTIIDCGANRGGFARHCAERYRGRVVAYEADPEVAALLPELKGVTFVNAAVAAREGTIEVRRLEGTCSSVRFHESTRSSTVSVDAVTLEQIMDAHGIRDVDLLKLDIEGAELDVLESTSTETLSRCNQITCEFHDFIDPQVRPRIRRILRNLQPHFVIVSLSVFCYGDVLLMNRNALGGCLFARMQLLLHKYAAGLGRIVRRAMPRAPGAAGGSC